MRLKYREAPIEPKGDNAVVDSYISLAKKVKAPEEEDINNRREVRYQPPTMFPWLTQQKRVVTTVSSDELTLRKKQSPNVPERIDMQKEWLKVLDNDMKDKARKETLEKMWKAKVKAAEDAAASGGEIEFQAEDDPDMKQSGGEKKDEGGIPDDHFEDEAEFKHKMMEIKEASFLKTRNTLPYHQVEKTEWEIKKLYWRYWLGAFETKREYTEVLPWLIVGNIDAAKDSRLLMKMNITHVMNCTNEVPNFNAHAFIYQRIAIADSETADAYSKFPIALKFMKRVYDSKGCLFVHCTAGASRAPTFVIAYLISQMGITLLDAFQYLLTIRPLMTPNPHFLFHLAKLEIDQGEGCSVLKSLVWQFFEFNRLRPKAGEFRESPGLKSVLKRVYGKQLSMDDDG